ncbi:hypothetical protein GO730_05615 [Spirosoma sp. HMF3257]|uniref:Uncharacterized protein n=1 Tax=Spirosoma telluris TaxID=2183553 RepID=A0A327NGM8_9BACT|nr:hypothetical protein [Spirosoma telluris]RAI73953.1 hypothetical protein HMF3257_05575 [Spirosoma telluris]
MSAPEINRITESIYGLNLEGLTIEQKPDKIHLAISHGIISGTQLDKIQQITKGYCLLLEAGSAGLSWMIWGDLPTA